MNYSSLNVDDIINLTRPYTMTSYERQRHSIETINFIIDNNIAGDIVEIGVWRGGMIMTMLYQLLKRNIKNRHIHLYDTFTGMTEPCKNDFECASGRKACDIFEQVKCEASFEECKKNVESVGYPSEFIHFHVGDIRNVSFVPEKIAFLRLDNDWYELYKFELPIFEPRVVLNGVITIDDYGHWNGCKQAVDEYILAKGKTGIKIQYIDYTGVYWIKS